MSSSKPELRKLAREKRGAFGVSALLVAQSLARHAEALDIFPGMTVGGYHAFAGEASPALLLERLVALGCHVGFPRVTAKNQPLEFHRVPDGEALRPGAFGILEPLDRWPRVTPDLILVPLLAFDASGHRLGYGGGFYDRTLASFRGVRAVGIAYAGQETTSLPHDAHDMALDSILTEQGIRHFR